MCMREETGRIERDDGEGLGEVGEVPERMTSRTGLVRGEISRALLSLFSGVWLFASVFSCFLSSFFFLSSFSLFLPSFLLLNLLVILFLSSFLGFYLLENWLPRQPERSFWGGSWGSMINLVVVMRQMGAEEERWEENQVDRVEKRGAPEISEYSICKPSRLERGQTDASPPFSLLGPSFCHSTLPHPNHACAV